MSAEPTPRIRSFADLAGPGIDRHRPVVTLFSGGLDSTYLLHRLAEAGFTDVHAFSADLGAGEDADELRHTTEQLGVRLHLVDARQTFADAFVRPAIAAQAVYLDTHPVSSSLSRPLIARLALDLAEELDAAAVVHTANPSQNTLRRLNGALRLLDCRVAYGSPYDLEPVDRARKTRELEAVGLPHLSKRVASVDANLWCREFESGVLDDPEEHTVPEHLYTWTARRAEPPADETVEITFTRGTPTALDGAPLPLTTLIDTLNRRAGAHGIGRYSGLEHLPGGHKVLELREMPAAALLLKTYRHLETATLAAETVREKMHLEQLWVREALEGRWYGELRTACDAFIAGCAARVTGTVRWHLSRGGAQTRAIRAEEPLYVRDREEWERTRQAR
ncbi:argininosuccinate synthase-related protein [Streptomyces sp. VRA16 Mangrove soil]|uniref:argininosuccinate synthase-related protein n=1 Tax=Streptomyces sp. VRA16 Mangrove soil TaxID=2817434 RepID=UPI001A9F75E1|nr:argininosuccinate synthase-related protein [Streptomyces sp. VRA16 Mangrove soil]MBO1335679.1 argininosuccinate synthase-related protein [Streptomyces sp. VRA16 Mangrove soil]